MTTPAYKLASKKITRITNKTKFKWKKNKESISSSDTNDNTFHKTIYSPMSYMHFSRCKRVDLAHTNKQKTTKHTLVNCTPSTLSLFLSVLHIHRQLRNDVKKKCFIFQPPMWQKRHSNTIKKVIQATLTLEHCFSRTYTC